MFVEFWERGRLIIELAMETFAFILKINFTRLLPIPSFLCVFIMLRSFSVTTKHKNISDMVHIFA